MLIHPSHPCDCGRRVQTSIRAGLAALHRQRLTGVVLALLCGLLGLQAASASAATMNFQSGFGASAHLGEGGEWRSELTFTGSEYHGHVAPLTELTIRLPAGTGLSTAGFGTCSKTTLEQHGWQGCPSDALAGAAGSLTALFVIGTETLEDHATVQPVFGPSETLYVAIDAQAPVPLEIIAEGHYVSDSSPYGHDLVLQVPLEEAVPGAPDMSTTALTLNIGATHEEDGTVFHSVTVPSECPLAGTLAWAAEASLKEIPTPATTDYAEPCPPSTTIPNLTWTGKGSSTAWSEATNWLGGSAPAPSSSIETLTFPLLPTFQDSENDLSGLSVNHLQVDDSHGYALTGQGFSLGSGGLSIGASEGTTGSFIIATPIALSSSQTWNISEPTTEASTKVSFGPNVELGGALSGETAGLTINLSDASLTFGQRPIPERPSDTASDELGEVTINGAHTATGADESLVSLNLANFNTSDGHALNLHNVTLEDYETATGPIVATESSLYLSGSSIGPVTANQSRLQPENILSLPSLSLGIGSSLNPYVIANDAQAGSGYGQIISTGAVALGGAMLGPIGVGANNGTECPAPIVGQVDTLISTTGSLTGTFGNAPNGSTIVTVCVPAERWYSYRVNYNTTSSPKTVTLTALPAVPTLGEPPTIAGTATEGQVLTVTHGYWTNGPTSYSDQWQRCNSEGNNCQTLAGAAAQSYTLTTADVGSTIRVQETASNNEGTSAPEVSAPTAVVQASSGGSGGGSTPNDGSSAGSTASTGSSGSGSDTTATTSSAQIAALLGQQLIPSGKLAKISALLKNDGFAMSFEALKAGTLSVQWYEVPAGAKAAKHTKAKPVLVASGQMTFTGAGTEKIKVKLTAAGKGLLRHAKQVQLIAKGIFTPSSGKALSATRTFAVRR